ncbi:hypothetical protein FY140_10125 [Agrobacterium tumefaciens]|uniref:hypothetical protein n=1 Tax=Agrobacterium tumefaciens TaxID=358 RepID=UPI0021D1F198|nr:hypothetical protein [Agrobacterium tumefaciens]UXT21049.1 hypothetical protein FY140_10125 [Agrobacterium tumefaciens]
MLTGTITALIPPLQLRQRERPRQNLPARFLRPLLFVEPHLQWFLPLVQLPCPLSPISRAISLRISPSRD